MPGVFIGAMNITTMAGSVISWPMFWPRKLYCVSAELVPTTLGDHLFARVRRLEEFVGIAAGAGVGRRGQHVMPGWVVQRVVKQRHRGRRVAERRMRGDVLDALAINVDVAAIASDSRNSAPVKGRFLPATMVSGRASGCSGISSSHGQPQPGLSGAKSGESAGSNAVRSTQATFMNSSVY